MGAVTFTVVLTTEGTGAYRRLRRTLKTALRRDQLRAVDVREIFASPDEPASPAPAQRTAPNKGDVS